MSWPIPRLGLEHVEVSIQLLWTEAVTTQASINPCSATLWVCVCL